jgi:hypothetical protein
MEVVNVTEHGDPSPQALPYALTWSGHEWLDATWNDTIWHKVKAKLAEQGLTATFEVVKTLAITSRRASSASVGTR